MPWRHEANLGDIAVVVLHSCRNALDIDAEERAFEKRQWAESIRHRSDVDRRRRSRIVRESALVPMAARALQEKLAHLLPSSFAAFAAAAFAATAAFAAALT